MRSDRVFNGRDDARGFLSARKIAPCRSLNFLPKGRKPSGGANLFEKDDPGDSCECARVDKARFFFDARVDETDGTVVRRVYVVLVSPHRRARIPRFRPFFLLSLIFWTFYSPHAFLFSFMFNSSRARRSPSKSSLRTPSTTSRRKSKTKRASRRISSD